MKANKIYMLVATGILNTFSCLSQQGHWQILKTKNDAAGRSECGLAASDGKLYLIGGDGGQPQAVESFDPKTLTWTKLAPAPVVMHHFQAVSNKDKIYVLDAFSEGGFPDQTPMSNGYLYDIKKDKWQQGAAIAAGRRRGGAGAAEYNGKLYLVAGIQHGHSSGTTNMFDEYDPQTDTWTALPDAPHIRDHCSAAVIKDKLYAVGGRNTSYHEPGNFMSFFSKTVLEVDCYDFKTRQWTTLAAKLPLGSGGGAVVNLNDKLYYMGGERATKTESNAPRKNTYWLDPSSQDQWIETDSLNNARNGMAAAVLNNKIYIAGGAGGGPGGPPPANNPNKMPQQSDNNSNGMPPPPKAGMKGPGGGSVSIEIFTLK